MQQNYVNRLDEARGKELSRSQKLSDNLFLTRRFLQAFNPQAQTLEEVPETYRKVGSKFWSNTGRE